MAKAKNIKSEALASNLNLWRMYLPAVLFLIGTLAALAYWHFDHTAAHDYTSMWPNAATTQPKIPADATPEMKEFLQNQAVLAQKMEDARKQAPNGVLTPQLFVAFRQQNAALLDRQNELAKILGQQQVAKIGTPTSAQPAKVNPQLAAYLKFRDQLMQDEATFMNQHKDDSLAARQVAIQKWRQANAGRFQELQQLLATANPPTK